MLHPLRKERRSNLSKKHARTRKRRVGDRQLAAQMHTYNKQGHARTKDYNMQPKGRKGLTPKGKGGWKKWTPEAILKAGSSDPTATNRSSRIHGGSHTGTADSRAIHAETIVAGQERGLAAIAEGSRTRKLDFYITNNMCDETKLPFGKPLVESARAWLGTARSLGRMRLAVWRIWKCLGHRRY